MANPFNQGNMSLPPSPFSSKQRAYKRRAYGSVTAVGNDQFDCTGGGIALTFGGDSNKKYSQGGAINPRNGGRYAPNPHLTSITTKNQGSGDISDTALWEIEFQYTCYSTDQLNKASNAFMVPGNLINVVIGYDPGDKLTINNARLYDFSWSYNSDDFSYSCTGKCLGENSKSGIAGALKVKPSEVGTESVDLIDDKKVTGYSLIKKLQNDCDNGLDLTRRSDGKLTGPKVPWADGTAVCEEPYALLKLQRAAGGWSMFWSGGAADNILVSMVQLKEVIAFLDNIAGGGLYEIEATYSKDLKLLQSADPVQFCFPSKRGKYGDGNDFSTLRGNIGDVGDIYVSTDKLMQVEGDIMDSKKEDNKEYTINEFLNKLFSDLNSNTGGGVDCMISENGGKFYIVNRKSDIKKAKKGSVIQLLDPNSPVKSLSMSSNMDPDMAAIAFAGGGGKYPTAIIENVFSGCTPKTDDSKKPLPSPEEKLQDKIAEIGENYSAELAQDMKGILKEYVNQNLTGISMRYGIDLSVTFDGWDGPNFMEKFSVQPLPNAVSGADIYYVVGEIEHKCDGETWDTTVVGYMMVNA
jgi:hypothetical protein